MLGAMVGSILLVSFFLPGAFSMERATVIDKGPTQVFGYLEDLQKWREWDPWSDSDPSLKYTYTGTPGLSQAQSWTSTRSGAGTLSVTSITPEKEMVLRIDAGPSRPHRDMIIRLEDLGSSTRVTWSVQGENRWQPIGNLLGLGMSSYLGPIYERGLRNLKSVCETGKRPPEKRGDMEAPEK